MSEVVDLESLSLEELKQLAVNEAGNNETDPVVQQRDGQGRFIKPQAAPEADGETVVYRREIDLGDGSGKEVFEADSMEALLDKIVEAKTHATRKIREQQQQLNDIKHTNEQTTSDDEFVLSQELMSSPTEAIKKLFKKTTGYDISEFKTVAERSRALETAQVQVDETKRQEDASVAFTTSHPEYVANAANGKRLVREINSLMGEAKAEGRSVDYAAVLEQAFTSLTEDGLLQLTSDDAQARPAKATPQVTATPAPAPRRASSLASRAPVANQPRSTELTEADLYSMPLDQLKELAERHSR